MAAKNNKNKSSPAKSSRRKKRSSPQREPEFNFNDLPPWAQNIIIFVICCVLVWTFIIQPIVEWVQQNIAIIITIFGGILILAIIGFVLYWKYEKKREEEEQKKKSRREEEELIYEEEQRAKGFVKFVDRFGDEGWGLSSEIEKWRKKDEDAREEEKLINQISCEVENFKHSRKYRNEFPYQIELLGYLKSKFSDADIEQQKGSSRPDIVIGDVAIEVKGPTKTRDLETVADKCMRYYQHFGELVVVLFEVEVSERRYGEWEKGMETTFPNVRIIRK
ncbi:MAG: hypothetical protein ACXQTY_00315 [Candidatus Methanogasteraceae archaeon]